jgi:hypothetical protein
MEKSETLGEIAKAIGKFQAEVENVTKDGTNPFFKSKYATLKNVIETIKPHLQANDLSFVQMPDGDGLTTLIMHKSGEYIEATGQMVLKEHNPQARGSAITYDRRYALCAALGLATEDDDDGNSASQSLKTAPEPTKAPRVVSTPTTATVLGAKKLIMAHLTRLGHATTTKAEIETAVGDLLGLDLTDDNVFEIEAKLSKLTK